MRILKNDWIREGASIHNQTTLAPSFGAGNDEFPAANLADEHTGIPWAGAPVSEAPSTVALRIGSSGASPDTTVSWTWVRRVDGVGGNLAAMQNAIQMVGGDYANVLVTRSETSGLITFDMNDGGTNNLELLWTFSADTVATGKLLGFDSTSDDTGAGTYTADSPRRYNRVALIWDLGDSLTFDVVALVGHNLVEGDSVQIRAHASDLGDNLADWSGATYSQDYTVQETVTRNPILRLGLDSEQTLQWVAVFVTANTGRTSDNLRIGVMQVGQINAYTSGDTVEAPQHTRSMQMGSGARRLEMGRIIPPTRQMFMLEASEWSHANVTEFQDSVEREYSRRPTCVWLDSNQEHEGTDDTVYGLIDGNISTSHREGDIGTFPIEVVGMTRGF